MEVQAKLEAEGVREGGWEGGRAPPARAPPPHVDGRSFRCRPSRHVRSRTRSHRPMTGSRRRASVDGASRTPVRPARWREVRVLAAEPLGGRGRVSSRAKFVGSTVRVGQERARHQPKTYRAVGGGDGQGSPPAAPVGTASCASRDRCGTALTSRDCQMAANGRSFVVQLPRTPLKSVPSAGL